MFIDLIKKRRSYYNINKEIPVSEEEIINFIKEATELVPDAFNMKSQRLAVFTGQKHDELWDSIYDEFGGKVAREKIDSFKSGYGTIIFSIDENVVKSLQDKFPNYADRFPSWAEQANAMLQFSIWVGLTEMGLGASIQHYNPVIDEAIKKKFDIKDHHKILAQLVFGGIVEEPQAKEKENDINHRVKIIK